MPEQGATYTFEDASGSTSTPTDDPNPYHALINDCANDPVRSQRPNLARLPITFQLYNQIQFLIN